MRSDRSGSIRHKTLSPSWALALVLAATVAAGLPAANLAQAAPTVQLPTREEIERGVNEGTLEREGGAVSVDSEAVERAPCPLASPDFAGIRLRSDGVDSSGTDSIPGIDLSDSYRPFVGTEQPVAVICEFRDRAVTTLRAAGSIIARSAI